MAEGDTDPALQSSIDENDPNPPLPEVASKVRTAPARVEARRASKATGKPRASKAKGKPAANELDRGEQAKPTQPRAVDAISGLLLDVHGLPISGPARRRWLEDAGIEIDPALKAQDEAENADG